MDKPFKMKAFREYLTARRMTRCWVHARLRLGLGCMADKVASSSPRILRTNLAADPLRVTLPGTAYQTDASGQGTPLRLRFRRSVRMTFSFSYTYYYRLSRFISEI